MHKNSCNLVKISPNEIIRSLVKRLRWRTFGVYLKTWKFFDHSLHSKVNCPANIYLYRHFTFLFPNASELNFSFLSKFLQDASASLIPLILKSVQDVNKNRPPKNFLELWSEFVQVP